MANEGIKEVHEGMPGYIKATHWATPYFSNHHFENPQVNLKLLEHVNCGYLSTPGRPPTLESLKQHAQSLSVLISSLAPTSLPSEVDNKNSSGFITKFEKHEAFDWLNDLQVPYDNIDRAHRKPLNSLLNIVKGNSDTEGVEFHCPLTKVTQWAEHNQSQEVSRPFNSHLNLLMHANDCLERLDHEYSALGGLLSIIPTDREDVGERQDLEDAKGTLIGQWILHTQHLVGRMHELEIAYANALDLLKPEALVPAQSISAHGPDGRSGREIVYPQDRWILANAGEDVFNFIHQRLDKKEAALRYRENAWAHKGVVGQNLNPNRRFDEDEDNVRGIAHIDLNTRFYRLKGSGHGPIFVLPAFSDRPGTAYTRELEERPTVITVTAPSFPESSSAWDKRNMKIETEYMKQSLEITKLTAENIALRQEKEMQEETLKRSEHMTEMYEQSQGLNTKQLVERAATAETARDTAQRQLESIAAERNQLLSQVALYKQTTRTAQTQTLPGVTSNNGNYTLNEAAYAMYEGRSMAVTTAKQGIARSKQVLESLAKQGHLDPADFSWIDSVLNCA
ncbi:hypothetical protein AAE478_001766 [Parahypoxylon ruwenzoriense]